MKQFLGYGLTLSRLRLPEVVDLLRHQKLIPLLQCDTEYNENLVKLFYASLVGNFEGSSFTFSVQNNKISVGPRMWQEIGIYPPQDGDAKITDSCVLAGFEYRNALNSMLKIPYPERIVHSTLFPRTITAGMLLPLERILQWFVCRIIRPKKGEYSRVDQSEVQLIYAIKNRIQIDWPYYIVSRMFELKKSGRGGALGYASLIQTLFNKSGINLSGIKFVSISPDQEFTQKTLSMMGHIWDSDQQKYIYYHRGNSATNQRYEDDDGADESDDELDADYEATPAEMEEDDSDSSQTTGSVTAMLEDMRLQQQENVTLINERISTLSDQFRVQQETFSQYSSVQEQRYNALSDMIVAQSSKFEAFSSAFLQRFPPSDTPNAEPDNS